MQLQTARLIPISGIGSDTEAEQRSTSALLAVLSIVRDLSKALLDPLGASTAQKASVETFIEPTFKTAAGRIRPDGLIRVSYGKTTWSALVEVKTGDNRLDAAQVNAYWDLAREYDFNAVLTISNEIGVAGSHPCAGLRVRANSKVAVHHYSWTEVLTEAVKARVHRGVSDPEQAWILGELIRYLEHPASGALAMADMGPNWTSIRDAGREGALRRNDESVRDFVQRWDQLLRFAALKLGAETGAAIQVLLAKNEQDAPARVARLIEDLVADGTVTGTLRIPNAAGDLAVELDLRAQQIVATMDVRAPGDKAGRGSVTWLLRQLAEDCPAATVIEAYAKNARTPQAASLAAVRVDPNCLIDPSKKDIARFRLMLRADMGKARKAGARSAGITDSVLSLIKAFYRDIGQRITPWVPSAPKAVSRPVAIQPEETATEIESPAAFAEAIALPVAPAPTPEAEDAGAATGRWAW